MSDKVVFKKSASRPARRARDTDTDTGTTDNAPDGSDAPITLAAKLKSKTKRAHHKSRLSFGADDESAEEPSFQIKKSTLSRRLTLGAHPALSRGVSDQAPANGAPVYNQAHLLELKASTHSTRRPVDSDIYDTDAPVTVDESSINVLSESVKTVIPSQSRIVAVKEQRERLRVGDAEQEYISLSVAKRDDIPQGPHPESRLMREEDELGEGDDEYAEYTSAQERIALGKRARKVEASKRRDTMMEMIADGEDEDEETLEWEREQLRRGGHGPTMTTEPTAVKQIYKAAQIPSATDVPVLSQVTERFQRSLASLSDSHVLNTGAIASLAEQRVELDTRETELRSMIIAAESKRSYFTDFKEWIESVATFLDEKFPRLEELEKEHLSILTERAEMITQRRRYDDGDDLSTLFGIIPKSPEESEKCDESLRASDSIQLREGRRTARMARRAHQHRRTVRTPQDLDGYEEGHSTDSSLSPADTRDYQRACQRIAAGAKDILSDVHSTDFRDPNLGLAKWFGEWRERYSDSYIGAWGGLGLVGAWEFWVRLEILGWNPFESKSDLDQFSWYSSLYQYSRLQGGEDSHGSEFGPDGDIASAMISTAVIPRLSKMVEAGAFDPYSSRDVGRMIELAEQVEATLGTGNNKFQLFLKSAHSVFDIAVLNAKSLLSPFLQLNDPPFDPEAAPARQRLLNRGTKLLENMLRWRKYTGDKHATGELCIRLVNNCLLPIAESGWEVGGERKIRQVVTALPRELASSVNLQ